MAKTIKEIMNRELFLVRADERIGDIQHYLVALGITGAPVVDAENRPVGFITLRDLLTGAADGRVHDRMSVPADTISVDADIDEAAARLCELDRHHLICVNDSGNAVGFVGSLDVLRGITGQPVSHPGSFPHYDPRTGLPWSDEAQLKQDTVREKAPDGPGMYVLVAVVAGSPNRVVWSGADVNVRQRLLDFLTAPKAAPPHLAGAIERGELFFQTARAPSATALKEAMAPTTA